MRSFFDFVLQVTRTDEPATRLRAERPRKRVNFANVRELKLAVDGIRPGGGGGGGGGGGWTLIVTLASLPPPVPSLAR